MRRQKEFLNSPLGRGLIYGLVLSVIFVFVDYNFYIGPRYLMPMVFLTLVGLIAYKFVGMPVPGLISGLSVLFGQELFSSIAYRTYPFAWMEYLRYSWFVSELLPLYAISFIGFPLAGFIGGYVCERRGISRLASSDNVSLSDLESRVFQYIRERNNQIQITDCALELGVDSASVKKALKSLEKKGKLKT